MPNQFNQSRENLQSKCRLISEFACQLLVPDAIVNRLCAEIDYTFRDRLYSPMITVWLFLMQVLSPDKSCQNAMKRLNAWRTERGLSKVSCKTTSFCQARCRLPEALFEKLLAWAARQCEQATQESWLCWGRVVELVDGWTITMADTNANQKAYPQIACRKRGCGFPLARMVGMFSLATGAVNSMAMSAYQGKETGETSLLRTILDRVLPGRILLADRCYASFWLHSLSQLRGIDVVARAHHLRKIDFRQGIQQGRLDQIVAYSKTATSQVDEPVAVRYVSQLDPGASPAIPDQHPRLSHTPGNLGHNAVGRRAVRCERTGELYRRRWQVELHIRRLKTQMTMEHLRCQTPAMVCKEVLCHLIGYNIVHAAIIAAALKFQRCLNKLSFTGTLQAIEEFASYLRRRASRYLEHWECVLTTIAQITVGNRANRKEPRELKRRPKQYKLMQTPRRSIRTREVTMS